uniref:Protocadherin domain-containing protein n=1 Tax=Hucho hucho TaxID=62062 RepID=A0A4W5PTW4_9TELE
MTTNCLSSLSISPPSFPSPGTDLFSNCTEECKALGHSDRCWMPSFVPSDGRQAADYRSNLHVPGMDSVPDTEVFESQEQTGDKSFSTFGKETPLSHHHQNHLHLSHHHATHANQAKLERKAFEALLSSTRAPYKPAYLTRKGVC